MTMHAIVLTGGKQYRVAAGDVLRVERLEAEEGDEIQLGEVLAVGTGDTMHFVRPRVEGARVAARVRSQGRGKKIDIIKFRRRKHHRKHMGHRQHYTELEITGINPG